MDDSIRLDTDDLAMRFAEIRDVYSLLEIYGDEETMNSFGLEVLNKEQIIQLIDMKKASYQNLTELYFVIVTKNTSKVVGFISIFYKELVWQIEFSINRNFRNKGYASQSLTALLKLCQDNEIFSVMAKVKITNVVSIRLLQNFGFKIIGTSIFFDKDGNQEKGISFYKQLRSN